MKKDNLTIISAIIASFIAVIFTPFIVFWFAYFGGWLCSLIIGDILAEGLNSLFNTTHFKKDIIPLCAATLGWIGGYFKSKLTNNSTNN